MTYLNLVRPGLANASSYMSSGMPWAETEVISSGGNTSHSFPNVTKFVSVTNANTDSGHRLKVAFSENGLSTNYVLVMPQQTLTLEVKVVEVWMEPEGSYNLTASVCAGLTNIDAVELTSNWSGSAGVG